MMASLERGSITGMLWRWLSGSVLTSHHVAGAFLCSVSRRKTAAGRLSNFFCADVIAVNLQQDRALQKSYRENEAQTLL